MERSDCASHIFENVSGEKGEGKGEIEEKEKKEIRNIKSRCIEVFEMT